jgi:hypothetical protein
VSPAECPKAEEQQQKNNDDGIVIASRSSSPRLLSSSLHFTFIVHVHNIEAAITT